MVKIKKEVQIGDIISIKEEFSTFSTLFEVGDLVKITGFSNRGFDILHEETGRIATEVRTSQLNFPQDFVNPKEEDYSSQEYLLKKGDVLISKNIHSCDVRFVEESNEDLILLVNGQEDLIYYKEDFRKLKNDFKLLCKKEKRDDL